MPLRGLLLALLALSGAASADEKAAQVFSRASPSVYSIIATGADGQTMLGSGVVVADERIATNYHVIKNAQSVRVRHGNDESAVTIEASDPRHDLAMLLAPGVHAPAATIGQTAAVEVGQTVYAIGSPRGLELSFSEGLVSSLRSTADGNVIQTTASISPGSSGGGLFDAQGRLLAFTTAQVVDGQNLNFAVPVDWLRYVGMQVQAGDAVDLSASARAQPAAATQPAMPAAPALAPDPSIAEQERRLPRLFTISGVILLLLLGAKPAIGMLTDWMSSDPPPPPVRATIDRMAPFRTMAREELAAKKVDTDTWMQALRESQSDEVRAKASYIELRAQQLHKSEMDRRWELARTASSHPGQRPPPDA